MSKKEATFFSKVVTGTLLLNSKLFCVLFGSGATHSFISTPIALQLNLEKHKVWTKYRIHLRNA